jgi:hypothetical protein
MDYGCFLAISLGTGAAKSEVNYNAQIAKSWGVLGWLLGSGSTPLVDVFTQASADMVDIHISAVFKALHSEQNYLRIQVSRAEAFRFVELNQLALSQRVLLRNNRMIRYKGHYPQLILQPRTTWRNLPGLEMHY